MVGGIFVVGKGFSYYKNLRLALWKNAERRFWFCGALNAGSAGLPQAGLHFGIISYPRSRRSKIRFYAGAFFHSFRYYFFEFFAIVVL